MLRSVNDSDYGLGGGLWTADLAAPTGSAPDGDRNIW